MMVRKLFPLVVVACGLIWPATGSAEPKPIPVIELDRGNVHEPKPFASPLGDQLVTWSGSGADTGLHVSERDDQGGPFGEPFLLSATANPEPPSISFTPDGGLYAIWGISTTSAPAETTTRSPGSPFAAVESVSGCNRWVDSASGPSGEIAMACRYRLPTNPPDTIRWGSNPNLGPVTPSEDLVPAAYDNYVTPLIEWGPDGTIAIVSQGYDTTTNPPPANQTTRIRVSIRGSAPFSSSDIALATQPEQVGADRPIIYEDGTVAVPLSGSAGSRVGFRPPGPLSVFTFLPLPGEGFWGSGLDSAERLHVASGDSGARQYASYVRPKAEAFGSANPIPMPVVAGGGDAYLTGFEVAPDGTEYAIIRGDDGTYAASRSPGESFAEPIRLGRPSEGNAMSAVTRDGDLLVAWTHENGPDDLSIELSGLDKTPPEVDVTSFPTVVKAGQAARFTASASDAMGLEQVDWVFGGKDGDTVLGGDVTHTFGRPGLYSVAFTATDEAGQKTVDRRTVAVRGKPKMTVRTAARMKFRALAKRGVRVVVSSNPKAKIRIVVGTSRRNARLAPLAVKVVRKFRNRHVVRVKPRRGRLGKPRKLRLFVQVTGTIATGDRATKSRVVRVRR